MGARCPTRLANLDPSHPIRADPRNLVANLVGKAATGKGLKKATEAALKERGGAPGVQL